MTVVVEMARARQSNDVGGSSAKFLSDTDPAMFLSENVRRSRQLCASAEIPIGAG